MTKQVHQDFIGDFEALATAVHPAWHQAIIRLANVGQRISERLGWILDHDQTDDPRSKYAQNCRELVDMLIEYLDGIDPDPDLEPTAGDSCTDECEPPEDTEPSLGSLDRVVNQEKSYRQIWWCSGGDLELDDSDDEPSVGSCGGLGNQEHWAGGRRDDRERGDDTGIGDRDGLLEQVRSQDWQQGGMA